jgi:hypothetical protein
MAYMKQPERVFLLINFVPVKVEESIHVLRVQFSQRGAKFPIILVEISLLSAPNV